MKSSIDWKGNNMIILLFGISNVGKTETGKLLAKRLGYDFKDLDEEVKKYYKCNT